MIITEQSGAIWNIESTGKQGPRVFWVSLIMNSPLSMAKPGIIGFYAESINSALNALNN